MFSDNPEKRAGLVKRLPAAVLGAAAFQGVAEWFDTPDLVRAALGLAGAIAGGASQDAAQSVADRIYSPTNSHEAGD